MAAQRRISIRVDGRVNETSPYQVDSTLGDYSYSRVVNLQILEQELLKLDLEFQLYDPLLGNAFLHFRATCNW